MANILNITCCTFFEKSCDAFARMHKLSHTLKLRHLGHVGMATHDVAAHGIEVVYLQEGEDGDTGQAPVEGGDVVEETLRGGGGGGGGGRREGKG